MRQAVQKLGTLVLLVLAAASGLASQQQAQPPQPQTPRAAAPIDLTGYWVSVVTEDWRWRMLTPPKGDYASVPLTVEGRKVADTWDPAKAAGDGCKAYGAPAIMRMPGRLNITWENDASLKIETDAGRQTRRLRFDGGQKPDEAASWQGYSVASWEVTGGRGGRGAAPAPRGGTLKVVTTNLRAGYLRKNGVPYSENAVVTEYFDRSRGLRNRMVHRDNDCGRPPLPDTDVHYEHALQARARWREMESDSL